jgi:hypothetical protein
MISGSEVSEPPYAVLPLGPACTGFLYYMHLSLHNENWALGKLHDTIGAASDESFIYGGMAFRPDHQQVSPELRGKLDNVPHRMSGDDMGVQSDTAFLCHGSRPLDCLVKAPRRRASFLPDFFDELRHVVDLLHANHVKLGFVLPGDCKRQ